VEKWQENLGNDFWWCRSKEKGR